MVGEESKAGEDETMRCQPVCPRSPAQRSGAFGKRCRPLTVHSVGAGPTAAVLPRDTEGEGERAVGQLKTRACPVIDGHTCPPSGCSSHRRVAALCKLWSMFGVLPAPGGAGQAPLYTPCKHSAAGTGVCPACPVPLSVHPQLLGGIWQ